MRDAAAARMQRSKVDWDTQALARWLSVHGGSAGARPEELWDWEPRLDAAAVLEGVVEEQCSILAGILSRVDRARGVLHNADRPLQA